MRGQPVELSILRVAGGREPFVDWFQGLGNPALQAKVMQRLDRLQAGNIERARKWLEEQRRRSSR